MAAPSRTSQRVAGVLVTALGLGILAWMWTDPAEALSGRRGPAMVFLAPMIAVYGLAFLFLPPPPPAVPGDTRSSWKKTPPLWRAVTAAAVLAGLVHMFAFARA